jgi:hypothetical protein
MLDCTGRILLIQQENRNVFQKNVHFGLRFSHSSGEGQILICMKKMKTKLSFQVCSALILTLALTAVCSRLEAMDRARLETRVDEAVSQFGVDGSGVIVALLDRGIDWKNNDFRKDDGTTRIKYIFDLTDNTGASAPGNTYGRGTIHTEAQINAALTGGPTLATRDAVGHGTTTAGIAAGNGRNSTNRQYRGIAPNATIIVVKVVTEGAPAHDGEPAEAPFNDSTAYPVAIDFVRDKAVELEMPAVMLLNLGSIGGPTDGTSDLARKIDATVGPGKPGLVFVTGTGDDGGMPNHAGGNVAQGGTAAIQIQKGSPSPLNIDLWYHGNDRFDVSLQTPSGNFGAFASPATNDAEDFVQNATFTYYHKGSQRVFYGATNGKREIFINLTGPAGTYTLQLQGQNAANGGRFDAIINPSNISQPVAASNRFLNFVVPGSISDGPTAHNNIAPNSYVVRTNWTDLDGVPQAITSEGNPGELWLGSSVGPTFDGRLGVDVSAPGTSVFTTYNPTSYFAAFRNNLIQDGGGFYGRASAVSAAAPQVTGVIALMLQENPQLDAAQVKQILQNSARGDNFTGAVPNSDWGYGKLDATAALELVRAPLPHSQLLNVSTRMRVQTGESVLIGGFILTGTDSKTVIVRGTGPSLAQSISGALANPTLELFQGSTLLASNNDWKDSQQAEIEATGIPPTNDFESAIVRTLLPGSYTAILRGLGNTTGIGVVEAYDLNSAANSKLANISTRGFVEEGDNVMIGGVIVGPGGGASSKVVVRAIGPTLGNFGIAGALQDPTLDLVNSNGVVLRSNNNWRDSQAAAITETGLQPSDDREAALVLAASPGNYTAIVRGAGNTTGVGLVEVYNVQ